MGSESLFEGWVWCLTQGSVVKGFGHGSRVNSKVYMKVRGLVWFWVFVQVWIHDQVWAELGFIIIFHLGFG